jgi:phosphoenolpyruvate carboxykinase (GTP)
LFSAGSLNTEGLSNINWNNMFSLPKEYWQEDIQETKKFLDTEVGEDLPEQIKKELDKMEQRINKM